MNALLAQWLDFRAHCLPTDLPRAMYADAQAVFFAGAVAATTLLLKEGHPPGAVVAELMAFRAALGTSEWEGAGDEARAH